METTGQINIPSFVREGLYSHSMIWSPQIPVFRDDVSLNLTEEVAQSNQLPLTVLFDQVALVNMVTSCAVNLGHYKKQGGSESTAEIEMKKRIELVIRLAASQGHSA